MAKALWYAVMTAPRAEPQADQELRHQGFHTYYPIHRIRTRRRVPGTPIAAKRFRVEWIEVPKFMRYVFVLTDDSGIHTVNETRGVATVVRAPNGMPLPIRDAEMDRIMREAEKDAPIDKVTRKGLETGTIFRMKEGSPLEGLLAQISVDTGNKIRAYIEVFGRQTLVDVTPDQIGEIIEPISGLSPIDPSPAPR
jgi:transcription antitermination factor NusG